MEHLEVRDLMSAHIGSAVAGHNQRGHAEKNALADFSGLWTITSSSGNGSATISQTGKTASATFIIAGIGSFNGTGHVFGEANLKSTLHITVDGQPLTVKLLLGINNQAGTSFSGKATTKVPGLGKQVVNFNGTKV